MSQPLICLERISYTYNRGTSFAKDALRDISLNINERECVGIVGGNGSGKTTLALHFNGLLRPSKGKIYIAGRELHYTPQELKEIRKRVGLLFQYPEHQLFGKNVFEDVSFALTRHKELSPSAIKEKVKVACALVGLEDENFWNRSPWELSRGEMRRAALAGILVQNPQVLILDEPTVGLDAQGKKEILAWIKTFHNEGKTVIIIAHEVEEILDLVDRIIVLDQGQILTVGTPGEVFSHLWLNQKFTFLIPPLYQLSLELQDKGVPFPARKWRNEEIIDFYRAKVQGSKGKNKNN